jgi:2-polyprenyl-3-methyl-5-hydroxy-6-metoxy-1,4-benzoquinol methylase
MFDQLEKINTRPQPFEFYTAKELWTDEHTSKQMLAYHLNKEIDISSRNAEFIDRSVEWIATHFSLGKGAKVADFGCGPGLYTSRLAQRQADVTGIDFSKRSIQYAREQAASSGLNIRYIDQNYLDLELDDRFQLILMIFCDFCVLGPEQRKQMLRKFHSLVEPGGAVLMDVYSHRTFAQAEETAKYEPNLLDGFWSPNKYFGFLNTFKYEEEKIILDKYTIVEAEKTRTVYNWMQCYTPDTLEREFAQVGLILDELFSDVAGTPYNPENPEFAVIVKKACTC